MHDDALVHAWMADGGASAEPVHRAIETALAKDRLERNRQRLLRNLTLGIVAVLWVALIWCAAHGITPLVRGGYALMAAGIAIMLFAVFSFASWRVQARPGAQDALAQIHTSIVLLAREAKLLRTAPAWCAPVFIGGVMIAWWVYAERSHASAGVIGGAMVAGWASTFLGGRRMARDCDARRRQLEHVLSDLDT